SQNPQPLTKKHLDESLIDFNGSTWKELGLQLGLSYNYSHAEEGLRECLVKWLQRPDGGGPNWTTLVESLDKKPTADHF
uniref:Death domain-containing protein n=1 Tax=Amphimedon queenslandica TaxID=400682 RepID=A0A1X7TK71_AMPQE